MVPSKTHISLFSNEKLASKIKLFTALAPVARVDHVQGLFHYLSKFQSSLEWIWAELGVRQFLPRFILVIFSKTLLSRDEHVIIT